VKWLRTNNSKSVDTSRKHADFRDVATEFAPMQVNDADVQWLTHGSLFQRASRPRGLNSKPGVVSLKHLNCPCCVHESCSNASKWQWYSVAHTQIPVSICVCSRFNLCVCHIWPQRGLNSKSAVVWRNHFNCPWCGHGNCSNTSKWRCYSVAHTRISACFRDVATDSCETMLPLNSGIMSTYHSLSWSIA
jgi:hypothetical protein